MNFLVLRMLVVVSKNRTNVPTLTSQSLTLSATNRCLLVEVGVLLEVLDERVHLALVTEGEEWNEAHKLLEDMRVRAHLRRVDAIEKH